MKLVGIEKVKYVSKKTGEMVEGVNLHMLMPANAERGQVGQITDKQYISLARLKQLGDPEFKIGSDIVVYYNRYGSVDSVKVN